MQVSDLVDEGASISWTGTKGIVNASVKKDPASVKSLFGSGEKTGHYFPVEFKEQYYGEDVELTGRTKGSKTIKPSAGDPYLIQRLENLGEDSRLTAKVKDSQEEIFELDFSRVTKQ